MRRTSKKREITNDSLAVLLVIAIIISVAGTVISLTRAPVGTLGFATATGGVNATVSQDITITTLHSDIDFGSGSINETGATYADIMSNLSASINGSWLWTGNPYIGFRNDGNVDIDVEILSNKNATNFTCGGAASCGASILGNFSWWVYDNHTACTNETTTFTQLNTSYQTICQALDPSSASAQDLAYAGFFIRIPDDATGAKTAVITFQSSAS